MTAVERLTHVNAILATNALGKTSDEDFDTAARCLELLRGDAIQEMREYVQKREAELAGVEK